MKWGKIQLTMVQPVAYQWNFMFMFQEATLVKKEKNCGLLIKRTTGTIGMKRRFDKDKNFTSLNICNGDQTMSKCIHEVHSWLHEPDQICELSALTKDTRVIKWYRRHSSVRYVLFCRSACNFGVNQSNKFSYNITAS